MSEAMSLSNTSSSADNDNIHIVELYRLARDVLKAVMARSALDVFEEVVRNRLFASYAEYIHMVFNGAEKFILSMRGREGFSASRDVQDSLIDILEALVEKNAIINFDRASQLVEEGLLEYCDGEVLREGLPVALISKGPVVYASLSGEDLDGFYERLRRELSGSRLLSSCREKLERAIREGLKELV